MHSYFMPWSPSAVFVSSVVMMEESVSRAIDMVVERDASEKTKVISLATSLLHRLCRMRGFFDRSRRYGRSPNLCYSRASGE